MNHFVEQYFPGISCAGKKEIKVSSREVAAIIGEIKPDAISFRFFSKESKDSKNKTDYSAYHYLGKEYSVEEFKKKYPQLADDPDLISANRIVRARTGMFYPLSEEDIVVPA